MSEFKLTAAQAMSLRRWIWGAVDDDADRNPIEQEMRTCLASLPIEEATDLVRLGWDEVYRFCKIRYELAELWP